MPDIVDRIVVITGASGGLGAAVVEAFAAAGAATVVEISRAGRSSASEEIHADLAVPDDAARAIETVYARHGRIDVIAHLVGGFAGGRPVGETDDAVWQAMLSMNLNAAFYVARAALPRMIAARRGRFLAVASRTAVEPAAGLSAYGASKAGLVALVRTIALETRSTGVTANVVLPSVIDTPANRAANPAADFSRWVQPAAIARLLVWLASDAAGDVNGAAIPIYGGA